MDREPRSPETGDEYPNEEPDRRDRTTEEDTGPAEAAAIHIEDDTES